MKIESYSTQMASASVSMKSYTFKESVFIRSGNGALSGDAGNSSNKNRAAILSLSDKNDPARVRAQKLSRLMHMQRMLQMQQTPDKNESSKIKAPTGAQGFQLPDKDRLKLELIQRMVEAITGKSFKFNRLDIEQPNDPIRWLQLRPGQTAEAAPPETTTVQMSAEYHEFQEMSFQAKGIVNTSDGRQIQFDLNVLASYEFSSSRVELIQTRTKLTDPLIINFDGALPEFTKDRYAFDITIDGLDDNIYMPTNGSGFLALDKDGNGKIDNGSELFGASTGDGFYELSAYDEDGNGWIDENDSVFSRLKLMSADKDSGEFMLVSLKDSGVGAIYLGSTATNYQIKGDNNELVGVVRNNGIFLNENGSVGTIHHIDLTH